MNAPDSPRIGSSVSRVLNRSASTIAPLAASVESTLTPLTPESSSEAVTLRPGDSGAPFARSDGIGTRFGDYELIREIARGGMGVVYQARQTGLNRTVALKMILSGHLAGPDDVRRFYTEAEAAAQLNHSGIVPIYEVGEHAGQHFFSMGFVDGMSLSDAVREQPLVPREAAQIVKAIAEAMAYAHARGVIHRDLKPANVLLARIDPSSHASHSGAIRISGVKGGVYEPKVTDFGLAKKTEGDAQLTGTGQVLGTPSYMPPEQAMGNPTAMGPLSDVYSLGAVLYCLLTGRPPFQAATVMDTLMQVLEAEPASPRLLTANVPVDLETICLKCLQKEPGRRYASAGELAEELGRFLRNEPILARPVGGIERAWRWCRRNPLVAGLTTSAAVLLVAVAIVSTLMYVREKNAYLREKNLTKERDEANQKTERERGENDRKRAAALADSLFTAHPLVVPITIENLIPLRELAVPILQERFANTSKPLDQRLHAAMALAAFGQVETSFLVDGIATASDGECRNIVTALAESRDAAVPLLQGRFTAADATKGATIHARLAIVALHLGKPDAAIKLCWIAEDPTPRRIFEETLATWNGGLKELAEQVNQADDGSLRAAVCLGLGRMKLDIMPDWERQAATSFLLAAFQRAPDTGTHGAAEWALRQWNVDLPKLADATHPSDKRNWYVNSVGMTMLKLPAGKFRMGSERESNATPIDVTLTRAFYLADREVSVGQFQQFLNDLRTPAAEMPNKREGHDKYSSPTDAHPVQQVSWYDAVLFCNWLSRREGWTPCYERTGEKEKFNNREDYAWRRKPEADGYRLPTEAEWEYACRAGTTTDFSCGNDEEVLRWYAVFRALELAACGSRLPNGWGVCDMHGNLWEWCGDSFEGRLAGGSDPEVSKQASHRVNRGGGWVFDGSSCQSAFRQSGEPGLRWKYVGFRVAAVRLSQKAVAR